MRTQMIRRLLLAFSVAVMVGSSASASAVTDSLTYYYARSDVPSIERLYSNAATVTDRLLCSYRLYSLTQDERWLENLPSEDELSSARSLALLAAHWGFKAQNAPAWRLPTYGRRSDGILRRAQAINPNEPYVLLVDGQFFYYKPGIFGGDVDEAKTSFERLRTVLHQNPAPGIHRFEPEVWIWMCLRKQESDAAGPLKAQLLSQNPPHLFRRFLNNPPD